METRPHTHFSLWGFRFTIFDRAPSRDERPAQSATRPAKNRNALQASPSYARKFRESKARRTESQGRPPQSILTRSSHLSQLTAAEQESQVVEFRNGWTGSSVEFSGLPLVTPVEAVALPGGFREALLQNLEDDRAETRRERPALPPPERDRGSIPLDFIRRLAPRA